MIYKISKETTVAKDDDISYAICSLAESSLKLSPCSSLRDSALPAYPKGRDVFVSSDPDHGHSYLIQDRIPTHPGPVKFHFLVI